MSKKPVEVTLTELHRHTGDTINVCHYRDQPTIVMKRGQPFVVILSADDWEALREDEECETGGEPS